ncbi:C40 family peptidase [Lysinibacillus sphaericus]|uniref:Peptidoglycan hydrolase n=1 Tax=Lysinibacillus sphaericus OT4b.31 TaxID=1285586 RepID=R7Z9H5_LYSSH|nr:NlpC/P60 family protein [Lysinibacillus sphaericus]EON70797.1 peptidoglycan hydrolase [Lysinibacillus sphaericus OT4b.31]
MKKQFLTTTLALTLGFSSLGMVPATMHPIEVEAATTNAQKNAQAVATKADQLIQTGKSLIGKATYSNTEYKPTYPYKFSCASFLMYIFEKNGVDLGTYNENYMIQQGTYVARNQLQKGDLLFFKSKKTGTDPDHVGMYIGDNKMIHMADTKQNIVISDLNSKPYYTENYVSARRVLPTLLSANPATKGDKIVENALNYKNKVTMSSTNNEASLRFTAPGFVDFVYRKSGVNLGTTTLKEQMKVGTTVSRANLKKGDLVFFNSVKGSQTPSLVGIYAGDHRIIIPNSDGVMTRVLFVDYYAEHYITAKRVFSENSTPVVNAPSASADKIIATASSMTGKAKFGYTYNESSLTFTSAGFTFYVFKKHGIDLKDKLASKQALVGKAVQKTQLQKGDLLFFSTNNGGKQITQTGIYLGGNQYISMTANNIVKQNLNSTWAKQNYVSARRVL